jgi:translation initiation factor IF-2
MADVAIKKNSGVTVKDLCKIVGVPPSKLFEQLKEAGAGEVSSVDATLSEDQKLKLLSYLQRQRGAEKESTLSTSKKITLKRKPSVTELKVSAGTGRSKTVSVEVRKKRVIKKASEEVAAEVVSVPEVVEEKPELNVEVKEVQ